VSGYLSDRFGARPFATGGMLLAALSFFLLETLPINFSYTAFAPILLLNGIAMGIFASPNRAGVMNALPPDQRGAGAGMVNTFQNSAQVLSIGVFFTLIILGLASELPSSLYHGLVAHGVPTKDALRVSHLPPVGSLFAAFLGYNPIQQLLGATTLSHLPAATSQFLTGRSFFPGLIAAPFKKGLNLAFDFAIISCLLAAGASALRGGKYVHGQDEVADRVEEELAAKGLAHPVDVDGGGNGADDRDRDRGGDSDGKSVSPSGPGRHVGQPA
jgi:MFS family permease